MPEKEPPDEEIISSQLKTDLGLFHALQCTGYSLY